MSNISFELPRDVTRVWDLDVPIVNDPKNKTIKMYLTGPIEEPYQYNERIGRAHV